MTDRILARVHEVLGSGAAISEAGEIPNIAPTSPDALAHALALAHAEGWRVRLEGRRSWSPADAPADLAITTAALDRVVAVAPQDLVATVQAGAALDAVNRQLRTQAVWLAWDPPGAPGRSLGSVVATATAGALRHGFGPIRDHLLGCTLVTADGRIVRPGGTVVKNVAGYDLTRLMAGGFGAFGVIAELHLRLRAIPESDRTIVATGSRDTLLSAGRALLDAAIEAAACELVGPPHSPSPTTGTDDIGWTLALRAMGAAEGVAAELERARRIAALPWIELPAPAALTFWHQNAAAAGEPPITIRLAALPADLDTALELVQHHLGPAWVTAGVGSGAIRWAGDADVEALRTLRDLAARREIPLTLERGPWAVRERLGHYGSYRDGVGRIVGRLREVFDPAHLLQVALDR
jgi:glycolate oxidase FAD binding subunit